MRVREVTEVRTLGYAPARLAGIREEGHRRLGADEDDLLEVLQEVDDLFREVGNAFDWNATCAEFGMRRERVAQQSCARLCLHATGGLEARAVERRTA